MKLGHMVNDVAPLSTQDLIENKYDYFINVEHDFEYIKVWFANCNNLLYYDG